MLIPFLVINAVIPSSTQEMIERIKQEIYDNSSEVNTSKVNTYEGNTNEGNTNEVNIDTVNTDDSYSEDISIKLEAMDSGPLELIENIKCEPEYNPDEFSEIKQEIVDSDPLELDKVMYLK